MTVTLDCLDLLTPERKEKIRKDGSHTWIIKKVNTIKCWIYGSFSFQLDQCSFTHTMFSKLQVSGSIADSYSWFGESLFLCDIFHLWGISTYWRWELGVRLAFLLNSLVIPVFLRSDLGGSTFLMTLAGAAFSEGWPLVLPTFPHELEDTSSSLWYETEVSQISPSTISFLYSPWLWVHWTNISVNQTLGHSVHYSIS